MTIRLFTSEDISAPQTSTSGTNGDYLTILRACLVDGYGTRTPQGWTMPYSDLPNNKAVFRGVSGQGDLLRVDDNYGYQFAEVQAFESMTDVDTGVGQYPTASSLITANHIYKHFTRPSSGTDFNRWFLISNDEWFYYFVADDSISQNYPAANFFGEFDCVKSDFGARYILAGHGDLDNTTYANVSDRGVFDTGYDLWIRRDWTDQVNAPFELQHDVDSLDWMNPNPLSGEVFFEKKPLRTPSTPYIRFGTLPSLLRMQVNSDLHYRTGQRMTIDGLEYILIAQASEVVAVQFEVEAG